MIKIVFIALSFLSLFSFGQEHKATIIKAPDAIPTNDKRMKIFLGGSIDMGKAENWQAKLEKDLSPFNVIILNPRREDWNKDWQPVSTDKHFREQVEWELAALECADIIIMYFASDSQSPISLLEFGMFAKTNKLMVICPEGFWRKGNVDIVCDRYNIKTFETFDGIINEIENLVE